jgi:drug/metabolite transporter (DMT)-like permease
MSGTLLGVVLVVACAAIEGFAQMFFKLSGSGRRVLWIGLGLGFFAAETLIYSGALTLLDVGTAYPLGSLSFIAVAVLSQVFLGERVSRQRWIGVVLILVGAGLVVAHA